MEKTKTPISEYLASLPEESQEDMKKLDSAITKALPGVPKVMWEGIFWGGSEQRIIGYGNYKYIGSNKKEGEWFLIGLALQKNYITVFINAVESREYLAEKHKDEIPSGKGGKVKVGKSTVSFKKLEDINLDKLIEVIKQGHKLMSKNK